MRQVFAMFPQGRCLYCFHLENCLRHTAACTLYCGSVCAGELEEEGVQQLPSGKTVMVPVNCYVFNPVIRERGSLSSPPPCCWNTDLMHLCVQDVFVYVVCMERKGWCGCGVAVGYGLNALVMCGTKSKLNFCWLLFLYALVLSVIVGVMKSRCKLPVLALICIATVPSFVIV